MSLICPKCGSLSSQGTTHCGICGEPLPQPSPPPTQEEREIRGVGRFGGIMTAIAIAALLLIVVVGSALTFVTGCCGMCNFNSPPPPRPENPLAKWIGPIVGGIIAMWVVLAIVIFVIRGRKKP